MVIVKEVTKLYEKVYRDILDRCLAGRKQVSAFFLGGGGYTFPRWLQLHWPEAKIDVAEIDPVVVEANYQALGLPRDTTIRTFVGDARNVVEKMPPDARYDLVIGDAFNDLSVPFHLTTLEFTREIASHMTPTGVYLINVIDDWESGQFLAAYMLTLQKVFPYVYGFCTEADGVKPGRDTFVIVGARQPLEVSDWMPNHGNDFHGSVLTAAQLGELYKRCGTRILTDDNAPVENLLEPVVRKRN